MNYKISKFLIIGLLIFSCDCVISSDVNNINNYNFNDSDVQANNNINNNTKQFLRKKRKHKTSTKDVDKIVNHKVISNKVATNKVVTEFPNVNRLNKSNNITLSNNNCKCWFMSTFQLFVTALNQSEPNDLIRKTNFAKFVNHLRNMQNDFVRAINTQENNNVNLDNKTELKLKNEMYDRKLQGVTEEEWEYRNVMRDRTGKSNVIGERIDLISELIIWCLNNENWYNIVENKEDNKGINDITKEEEERRIKTVELLGSLQDINADGEAINCVMIILNLFPELKKIFGSFSDLEENIGDVILDASDNFILDVNEIEKVAREEKKFISKDELRIPKLSSYTPNVDFLANANLEIHNKLFCYEGDKLDKINKEKEYIILPYSVSGCRKSIEINSNNKRYELIGIQLANSDHSVCFVKTGKSDSSWSGIDSNRNANDDGYRLEDIIDDSNSEYNDNYERLDIIENNLKNENNYLAKIYYSNGDSRGKYNVGLSLNLYKNLSKK